MPHSISCIVSILFRFYFCRYVIVPFIKPDSSPAVLFFVACLVTGASLFGMGAIKVSDDEPRFSVSTSFHCFFYEHVRFHRCKVFEKWNSCSWKARCLLLFQRQTSRICIPTHVRRSSESIRHQALVHLGHGDALPRRMLRWPGLRNRKGGRHAYWSKSWMI